MSALSVQVPFPVFQDRDGQPLDNGYVWIGVPNLPPQTNPVNVYFDDALTQLAAQPLRTINGYISNAGTPAQVYVDGVNFSILVQDSKGSMVYNFPEGTGIDPNAAGIDYDPGVDSLLFPGGTISVKSTLDQITDKDSGSSLIGFNQSGAGAVSRTVEAKLREYMVSVKDYGATGNGVTDDRAAINLAFAEVINRGAGTVYFPAGTYRITDEIGRSAANPSHPVSIGVIGEPGTVIDCDPAVAASYCFNLQFQHLNIGIVKNIKIKCNDKVSVGLIVRGLQPVSAGLTELVQIDGIFVENCRVLDVPSATPSAVGIACLANLGLICSVTNSYVVGVTRDKFGVSYGIGVFDFINIFIANNSIFNVSHGNITPLQDSDGIRAQNYLDGDIYYRQSTTTIINNRVMNCDGRFVKLVAGGSAVVENNTFALTSAMQLIDSFYFVDVQAGRGTVSHNQIQSLSNWTGGVSAAFITLQFAADGAETEVNETFTLRCENNDIYTTKLFPFGVATAMRPSAPLKTNMIIKGNTFSRNGVIAFTGNTANAAVNIFFRIFSAGMTPANFAGQWVLEVSNNKIATTTSLLSMANTNNDDFADKWFFYLFDNFLYGGSAIPFVFGDATGQQPTNNCTYTSTLMVRDNNIGSNDARRNQVRVPLDASKILSGSDFETPASGAVGMTNMPPNWNSGRLYKKGIVTGVETVVGGVAYHYISTNNGTNWYQI